MFTSARSTTSTYSAYDSRENSPSQHQTSTPVSNPIQVAVLTGRQEIKLKTKQNDTLHGPKVSFITIYLVNFSSRVNHIQATSDQCLYAASKSEQTKSCWLLLASQF